MNLRNYFERVVLISLARRPDRLSRAKEALQQCDWPFKRPQVFPAVDGHLLLPPDTWQSGPGAWGCLRSHQQVFERAIIDKVESLLILEDDVCFADNFATDIEAFLRAVPDDWDALLIGGQHKMDLGLPEPVNPYVVRCLTCERTHCFAIRGKFMRKAYQRFAGGGLFKADVHCDWIMARDPEMQLQHHVYAPTFFLAGQESTHSDIMGQLQRRQFWNPPGPQLRLIHLQASQAVAQELREYGLYFGNRLDAETGINHGLARLIAKTEIPREVRLRRLGRLITELQWQVASEPNMVATIWHPDVSAVDVSAASLWKVQRIRARTIEEARKQLPRGLRRRPEGHTTTCVVCLRGTRQVIDGMRRHGWHNGYQLDASTGYALELQQLSDPAVSETERRDRLGQFVTRLQREAEQIVGGVAVIWHPSLRAADLRAVTSIPVVELDAGSVRRAAAEWRRISTEWRHDARL